MIVEILTIGDELLDGRCVDTNSAWIGRNCALLGVPPRYRQTVTDRQEDIVRAAQNAAKRADLVICTGGLGPTEDDITFEAMAEAFDLPLQFHSDIYKTIQERFERRKLTMPESNRRQAMLPETGSPLPNERGTAPGCRFEVGSCTFYVFPGVPAEMQQMFLAHAQPEIQKRLASDVARKERIYRLYGVSESHAEETIQKEGIFKLPGVDIRLGYKAALPEVDVVASVLPKDQSWEEICRELDRRMKQHFPEHWCGTDEETLEARVVRTLREKNHRLAVAESLTGGLITSSLISVPGSSEVVEEGLVTYSNAAKIRALGVSEKTLERHGAVSEACALEMVDGALRRPDVSVAIATTGIAGPSGATPAKPLGLTFISWAGPDFREVRKYRFAWDRNRNRIAAASEALRCLLRLCEAIGK